MTLLLAVLVPLILGLTLPLLPEEKKTARNILLFSGELLCLGMIFSALFLEHPTFRLFSFWGGYGFCLSADNMGLFFALLGGLLFLAVSVFALKYMCKEEHQNRFFAFVLCGLGSYTGMCFAGNLLSFYLFFEFLTLTTFPLVLHEQTKEAILGAKKYLFYSMGGALLAMGGILLLLSDAGVTADSFTASLGKELSLAGKWGVFLTIVGFSAKAGMFPLQSWLPSAHPVCPAPASALLSGLIVKAGVLGILRVSYFSVDPALLKGTPFQTVLLCLALFTVVCASTRAYFEPILKKRLAYSTVSNLSYILLGLFLFSPAGLQGALFHTVAHAFAKTALFLCAGEIIFRTGKTKVADLRGYGKKMPAVFVFFLLCSLSLIGIPPTAGFVSKWYLCIGALKDAPGAFAYLIPVGLLISALLTAAYLFKPLISAFYGEKSNEPSTYAAGTQEKAGNAQVQTAPNAQPAQTGHPAQSPLTQAASFLEEAAKSQIPTVLKQQTADVQSAPAAEKDDPENTQPEKGSALFTLPLLILSVAGLLFGFLNPLSELILSLV